MKTKLIYLLIACPLLLLTACQKQSLPGNPTLVSPISNLTLTVNSADYVATPAMFKGTLSDTLIVNVQRPSAVASVKQIAFTQNGATANTQNGGTLNFTNNVASIKVTDNNGESSTYFVLMTFAPPPILYVPLSSESYVVTPGTTQTIASGTYDNHYEGYIDFPISWLGFYIVTPATPRIEYGVNAGFSSGTTQTLEETTFAAPWGNWGTNGYWKFNYDSDTYALTLVQTNWAITGSATGNNVDAMTYSPQTKVWTISASLAAGSFQFTAQTTPALIYGDAGTSVATGTLTNNGTAINVISAGNYTVTMNLSNPPYYIYQVVKN